VTGNEIWMSGIDVTCLHTRPVSYQSGPRGEAYATRSETNLVVGVIDFLKKFTTTPLNRSRKAG